MIPEFVLARVSHFLSTNATVLARLSVFGQIPSLFGQIPSFWPQPGKCVSDLSEIGPVSDYGTETRLCSSKSRCQKVPAPSEIRTSEVAKKRGSLAKKRHLWPKSEKRWPKKNDSFHLIFPQPITSVERGRGGSNVLPSNFMNRTPQTHVHPMIS